MLWFGAAGGAVGGSGGDGVLVVEEVVEAGFTSRFWRDLMCSEYLLSDMIKSLFPGLYTIHLTDCLD